VDDRTLLRTAADRLEQLTARTTAGDWRTAGLLASRPEVIAYREGATEHVAEARAGSAAWITSLSPAVGTSLARWLRAAADAESVEPAATEFARVLLERMP
jgi:hypothetical protein